ncbi:hypothetical protein NEE01_17135 [Sphingomonas sp. MMSM24]|uniref:Uncharacterized protein n=1 Tax=Sphingomonas lycopersici TaxID=2951807 RepID=A0AA41ZBE0_9SPHN|nr:hypothetical protein [Sphingomonas lycopersici]
MAGEVDRVIIAVDRAVQRHEAGGRDPVGRKAGGIDDQRLGAGGQRAGDRDIGGQGDRRAEIAVRIRVEDRLAQFGIGAGRIILRQSYRGENARERQRHPADPSQQRAPARDRAGGGRVPAMRLFHAVHLSISFNEKSRKNVDRRGNATGLKTRAAERPTPPSTSHAPFWQPLARADESGGLAPRRRQRFAPGRNGAERLTEC